MNSAFKNAVNVTYSATDNPDLSNVMGMSKMFNRATGFNGNINGWNVSSVTKMSRMFHSASTFNRGINDWDVSSVDNMDKMFQFASSFNGDISSWNVSSVTNMNNMFLSATSFNNDIGGWNVSGVAYMENMFAGANTFSQNLGAWYVEQGDIMVKSAAGTVVTPLSAQNSVLSGHRLRYTLDENSPFIINQNQLVIGSADLSTGQSPYTVTINVAGGRNLFGDENSKELSITIVSPATVSTTSASSISSTSGTLNGNITSNGGGTVTERGFIYSTSNTDLATADATNITVDDAETSVFFKNITRLTPGTIYYYKAYAVNVAGTSYGDAENFTTLTTAPTITGAAISSSRDTIFAD